MDRVWRERAKNEAFHILQGLAEGSSQTLTMQGFAAMRLQCVTRAPLSMCSVLFREPELRHPLLSGNQEVLPGSCHCAAEAESG